MEVPAQFQFQACHFQSPLRRLPTPEDERQERLSLHSSLLLGTSSRWSASRRRPEWRLETGSDAEGRAADVVEAEKTGVRL